VKKGNPPDLDPPFSLLMMDKAYVTSTTPFTSIPNNDPATIDGRQSLQCCSMFYNIQQTTDQNIRSFFSPPKCHISILDFLPFQAEETKVKEKS